MDGMVTIMQKALQIYAGTAISCAHFRLQANVGATLSGEDQAAADATARERDDATPAETLFEQMLRTDMDARDADIREGSAEGGDVTKDALVVEV